MPVVRTSFSGYVRAALFIAAAHGVLAALWLLKYPDAPVAMAISAIARTLVLQGALLVAAHLSMRLVRLSSPWAYAAAGAGMNLVMLPAAKSQFFLIPVFPHDAPLAAAAFVLTVAAAAAWIYARKAGTETSEQAPVRPSVDGEALPVRARTSKLAFLIVTLVPAAVISVLFVLFLFSFSGPPRTATRWVALLAMPASVLYTSFVVTILPAIAVVGVTHVLARVMGRASGADYAAIAAGVAMLGACTLLGRLQPLLLFSLAALTGAIMGASYRKIAGLEPSPLPDPVQVRDPATLVAADQPARRMYAVVRETPSTDRNNVFGKRQPTHQA
jgi:hypothetical protein